MMNCDLLNRMKTEKINITIEDNLPNERRKRSDLSLKDLYAVYILKLT